MLEKLAVSPGLPLGELAPDVDYTTARYHIRRLAEEGRVVVIREGHRYYCYLPGTRPRGRHLEPRALAALEAVASGATTPASLARALGVPRGTAGSLLRRMELRGLLARRDGGLVLSPEVEAFIPRRTLAAPWSGSPSAQ